MLRKICFYIFFFFVVYFLQIHTHVVYADDDFHSDYQVEYFLTSENNTIQNNVNFDIQITNFRSDIFVSKFSISFPKTFTIRNLHVFDDNGEIQPQLSVDGLETKITMEFSKPNTGKGSVNNFHMHFIQDNLFKINGNVWEVILPTISNRSSSNYKIIVHLPPGTDKKISIAKPKPTLVSGNQITWDNPATKTIYALFGNEQLYNLSLSYHIINPNFTPVYTEIAFPPDTLYQKNYITSINPLPTLTYIDDDGNFIGRYFLKPKEVKDIVYTGTTELTSQPREEMRPIIADQFQRQQSYLLTAQKYWQINQQLSRIEPLRTVADVYHFARDTLHYDYARSANNNTRFGADAILSKPDQAVCVEFSDLFIASAREKGIYSREIEGYGYSFDPQLRPLSLLSDVLHSWPEYYDTKNNVWIPVDPTWENTSGIDYFSSLDLNHIAFAIHGKRDDYPLPADMYKTEDTHDIVVNATTDTPTIVHNIVFDTSNIPNSLIDNYPKKISITLTNKGNVFETGNTVSINTGPGLSVSPNTVNLAWLAPYESKKIDITFTPLVKNKRLIVPLNILLAGTTMYNHQLVIIPQTYDLSIKIAIIVFGSFFLMLLFRLLRNKK